MLKALRSLCLWEGWESLEPQVASAIVGEVSSGREPGPQSPYETRLTGEAKRRKSNALLSASQKEKNARRLFRISSLRMFTAYLAELQGNRLERMGGGWMSEPQAFQILAQA